ncbi:MAG: STAS domain-containing protein [Anaerolineales bacterium]|jgi:anti-sigma B factor antagonist
MDIETKQYKSCDLITVSGRIDSYSAPQLQEAVDEVTDADRFKIVLDMSGVEFMSSAGLRVLIGTQKKNKKHKDGEIVLTAVPTRIREALDLAGFTPLFKIYEETMDGIGHF